MAYEGSDLSFQIPRGVLDRDGCINAVREYGRYQAVSDAVS